MTVTINLTPETEQKLRQQAARHGQTLEAYLERLAAEAAANGTPGLATEEWIAAWRDWATGHRTLPHLADDSRESIYANRGE